MNYIFNLAPVDVNTYMGETAAALEKRTELLSRKKYPKMWEKTDAKNESKGEKVKVPDRIISKPVSWILLILGAGLFIPSMQDVLGRVIPLTAGAIAMLIGIRGIKGDNSDRFDKAAKNLLSGKAKLPEDRYSIIFDDEAMAVMDGENEENRVPYNEIECVVETENIYLVVFGSRVMVLLKHELHNCNEADDFAEDIRFKTNYVKI